LTPRYRQTGKELTVLFPEDSDFDFEFPDSLLQRLGPSSLFFQLGFGNLLVQQGMFDLFLDVF
jgi:hypothetical protein